jgi:hypothetical protein
MNSDALEYSESKKVHSSEKKREALSPIKSDFLRDELYSHAVERTGISNPRTNRDYQFAPDYYKSSSKSKDIDRGNREKNSFLLIEDYVDKIVSPTEANKYAKNNMRITFDYKPPMSSADLIRIDQQNRSATKELHNGSHLDRIGLEGDDTMVYDLVIERTDDDLYGNGSTPAAKQINKRIFRNEYVVGDDVTHLQGIDRLNMTSPFKNQNYSKVRTNFLDPISMRGNGHNTMNLRVVTPSKQTFGGLATNYGYTHSPRYTGYQPQDYSELNGHFRNLDELARGQERDINYLLGIGPKPSTGYKQQFIGRETRSSFKPSMTFSPGRLFKADRTSAKNQEIYKDVSLVPHLLTEYPQLKKNELDFQHLNKEKDINDSLLHISQNLLTETKRSLAKIRSASAIKSPEKESPRKPLAQTSVFHVVEQEKSHLKRDHNIDLDAVPVSRGSPTKTDSLTRDGSLVSPLNMADQTKPIQPVIVQPQGQGTYQNISTINTSNINQSQPYQQSWNQPPPAPSNSQIGNNPSTMTAGWTQGAGGINPATNSFPPSSNTSNYQPAPPAPANRPEAWPRQSDYQDSTRPVSSSVLQDRPAQVTPVVAQSSVIDNRPSFGSSVETINQQRQPPLQSATTYINSSYLPPASVLANPQPQATTTSYVNRTVTSTSFGPEGQAVTRVETTTQDGNAVRRTEEVKTGYQPTTGNYSYSNNYQYGNPAPTTETYVTPVSYEKTTRVITTREY